MTDQRILPPRQGAASDLTQLLESLETEFEVPGDFQDQALRAAEEAVANLPVPENDDTGLPFFTIDPPGATDLDQAMYLERTDTGYLVHYAIADVPAFVALGGLLDELSRERGQTFYLPQRKITLYPPLISEDRGSLLPEVTRLAFHWRISLDSHGALGTVELARTRIRSRAQLDYESAQQQLDEGVANEQLQLLAEIGRARLVQERLRGGASLRLPDQEIVPQGPGYKLVSRTPLPLEEYNAQISLLTGIAAARLMLTARTGILRTMPPPDPRDLAAFRKQTQLLGHPWPSDISYGEYLHTLDVGDPRQLVIMHRAASLFRGADYQVINGQPESELIQSALAALYTHTTAPLRRLVDRFVLLTCYLVSTGQPLPEALHQSLDQLPGLMRTSSAAANKVARAAVDLLEAYSLQHRIGEEFQAIVLTGTREADADSTGNGKNKPGQLQLVSEPITGSFSGSAEAGTLIEVRLVEADPRTRKIHFETVG